MTMRALLYLFARLLGNVSSVRRGIVGRWVLRQLAGRFTGRWLGQLFR